MINITITETYTLQGTCPLCPCIHTQANWMHPYSGIAEQQLRTTSSKVTTAEISSVILTASISSIGAVFGASSTTTVGSGMLSTGEGSFAGDSASFDVPSVDVGSSAGGASTFVGTSSGTGIFDSSGLLLRTCASVSVDESKR